MHHILLLLVVRCPSAREKPVLGMVNDILVKMAVDVNRCAEAVNSNIRKVKDLLSDEKKLMNSSMDMEYDFFRTWKVERMRKVLRPQYIRSYRTGQDRIGSFRIGSFRI